MPTRFILVPLILALIVPVSSFAATQKPTCTLVVESQGNETRIKDAKKEVTVRSGEPVTLTWTSKNAAKAVDGDKTTVLLSGSAEVSVLKKDTYAYTFTNGSKKTTCAATLLPVSGVIDAKSLSTESSKPTISGVATGAKSVEVIVRSGSKVYFKKATAVKRGKWSVKVNKELEDGTYDVLVSSGKGTADDSVASGKLRIGESAATTFSVSFVPLLFGGTAHLGTSVPVSYLNVRNTGTEPATLTGFWLKESGSAPESAVIGFTTVDDKGGSRGSVGGKEGDSVFKSGLGFAPTDATFAPGERKLFTVRAQLSNNASYLGKQLVLDVTSLDADATILGLPIKGVTWTIAR